MLCCDECFDTLENANNYKKEDLARVQSNKLPCKEFFEHYGYCTCSVCGAIKPRYYLTERVRSKEKQKAIIELKKTKELATSMLQHFNIDFETFLRFAQADYSKATRKAMIEQLIIIVDSQ